MEFVKSIREASKLLGIPKSTLCRKLKSKRLVFPIQLSVVKDALIVDTSKPLQSNPTARDLRKHRKKIYNPRVTHLQTAIHQAVAALHVLDDSINHFVFNLAKFESESRDDGVRKSIRDFNLQILDAQKTLQEKLNGK